MLAHLQDLQDSQMQIALLRSCLSLPKIAFSLRTCAPDYIYPALVTFDSAMRDALSDLVGGPVSDWSLLKASLPSSLGGLNLRWATLHAPAAYVASLHQCSDLVTEILGRPPVLPVLLPRCVEALAVAAACPDTPSDNTPFPGPSMKPRLISLSLLLLTLVQGLWPFHQLSLMQVTGSM